MKLTEELHTLKEKLEEFETSGDSKVSKIQELQMEIQDLTDQYELNK
jgi:uncharacterized membrane protein (DUF106 family)